jgi:hypothetical protein
MSGDIAIFNCGQVPRINTTDLLQCSSNCGMELCSQLVSLGISSRRACSASSLNPSVSMDFLRRNSQSNGPAFDVENTSIGDGRLKSLKMGFWSLAFRFSTSLSESVSSSDTGLFWLFSSNSESAVS